MTNKHNIPFDFILDYLHPKDVVVKSMFGCFSLYINNKICFFLRDRGDKKELNGIWIATLTLEDYDSLKKNSLQLIRTRI